MAARVRILATGVVLEARLGEDLLEVLQQNGQSIATSCGGVASCGLCRLRVVSGAEVLTPIRPEEIGHLGNVAKIVGLRLACQAKIAAEGDVVVDVPEVDDVEERKRKKAERLRIERHRPPASTPGSSRASASPRPRIEWRPSKAASHKKDDGQGHS